MNDYEDELNELQEDWEFWKRGFGAPDLKLAKMNRDRIEHPRKWDCKRLQMSETFRFILRRLDTYLPPGSISNNPQTEISYLFPINHVKR